MRTHVHNKWYLVSVSYLVLPLYLQKNAQRRTTQHRKTKGKTRHRTIPRCTELGVQQLSMYKLTNFLILILIFLILRRMGKNNALAQYLNSTGTWDDTANECYWHVRTDKSTAKHAAWQSSKARQSTALRSAKLELQGIAGHCTALRCCEL